MLPALDHELDVYRLGFPTPDWSDNAPEPEPQHLYYGMARPLPRPNRPQTRTNIASSMPCVRRSAGDKHELGQNLTFRNTGVRGVGSVALRAAGRRDGRDGDQRWDTADTSHGIRNQRRSSCPDGLARRYVPAAGHARLAAERGRGA